MSNYIDWQTDRVDPGKHYIGDWSLLYNNLLTAMGGAGVYYADYTESNHAATGSGRTIYAICDGLSSDTDPVTIILPHNEGTTWTDYHFTGSRNFNAYTRANLVFQPGARLTFDTGITVNWSGLISAGPMQIFSATGTGNIDFSSNENLINVMPQWWYSGSGSWHTAFDKAIDAFSSIYAPAGNYSFTTELTIAQSIQGFNLFGDGKEVTEFQIDGNLSNPFIKLYGTVGGNAARFCTFRDFAIINGGTYTADYFYFERVNRISLQRLLLRGEEDPATTGADIGHALHGKEWWDSNIIDVNIQEMGHAASSKAAIQLENRDTGDASTGCNNLHFFGCQNENYVYHALLMDRDCRKNDFIACKFHGSGEVEAQSVGYKAAYLDGAERNSFMSCNFTKGLDDQIYLTDSHSTTNGCYGNRIIGNIIEQAGAGTNPNTTTACGIVLDSAGNGANYNVISGNYFEDNERASIWNKSGNLGNVFDPTNKSEDDDIFYGSIYSHILDFEADNNSVVKCIDLWANAASPSDNDGMRIAFSCSNDAGTPEKIEVATLEFICTDVTDGTEDGRVKIKVMANGAAADTRLQCDPDRVTTVDVPHALTVLTSAPSSPAQGDIAIADRANWDPVTKGSGGAYVVWYDGSNWVTIETQEP